MLDLRAQLNQRAERGSLRGSAEVYRRALEQTNDSLQPVELISQPGRDRRRFSRWQVIAVAAAVVVVVVSAVGVIGGNLSGRRTLVAKPATTEQALATEPSAALLWVDARGVVEGNPKTGKQTRLPEATTTCQACPSARTGRYVFLGQGQLLRVDTADGKVLDLGNGLSVFPASGGASLYVVLTQQTTAATAASVTTTTVIDRIDIDGHRLGGPWTVPTGQSLANPPRAVVGGVLTQTNENASDHTLSVWNPATGHLSPVGPFRGLIDAYTAPGATSSLVAYTQAGCKTTGCGLTITRVPGGRPRLIAPPGGAPGFIGGGAFSPGGAELAAFVDRQPEADNPAGRLVIITVATGKAELITGSTVQIGEPYGFATWSPDGNWLYFGGLSPHLKAHYRDTPDAVDLALPAYYSIVAGGPTPS